MTNTRISMSESLSVENAGLALDTRALSKATADSLATMRAELASEGSVDFVDYCASRTGYDHETIKQEFSNQVIPFIAVQATVSGRWVPSAAIGTLMEMAASFGPTNTAKLAKSVHCSDVGEPGQYLAAYADTRTKLQQLGFKLNAEFWPEANSIQLADTKGYKGCSSSDSSDDYSSSYDYSSSSSSSSDSDYGSSSNSGSGDGDPVSFVVVVLGLLTWNYPYHMAVVLPAIAIEIFLSRWIPSWLNFLIWGSAAGAAAYLGLLNFAPKLAWEWQATAATVAGVFCGTIGIIISNWRQE